MKSYLLVIILLSNLFLGCHRFIKPEPVLFTMNYVDLINIKKAISENSPSYVSAFKRLIKEADLSLSSPTYSVTQKTSPAPSNDWHDYISQGPYWWPDSSKSDGLPYIRRDGVRNPESLENDFDNHRLNMFMDDVMTLSLAWFFTHDKKYAEKASNLIETWFLDPETAVNPNLNYAQAIPGIVEGRGIGIIETRRYIEIIDAIYLLENSPVWNRRMTKKLQKWFSDYLDWLLNSENGKQERKKENNHGAWYDAQVACFGIFVENKDMVKEIVDNSVNERIEKQIDPNGLQLYEIERTNSFSYSIFNLKAILLLGKVGETLIDDNWEYNPSTKAKLESACDYLFSYIDRMKEWPYEQISPVDSVQLLSLVQDAYNIFKAPEYLLYKNILEAKLNSNDRLIITKNL